MNTDTETLTVVATVVLPAVSAAAVAIIREIRKHAPNGKLTKMEQRLRRLEQRIARVLDHLLLDSEHPPSDEQLDAETSGEFRGIKPNGE